MFIHPTRSLASPHARRRGPEKLQGGVTTIPAAAGTGAALAREQRQRGGGARRGRRRQDGGPPHEPPRPEEVETPYFGPQEPLDEGSDQELKQQG